MLRVTASRAALSRRSVHPMCTLDSVRAAAAVSVHPSLGVWLQGASPYTTQRPAAADLQDEAAACAGVRVYRATSTDAAFNLATEEWLLRDNHAPGIQTLFLWRNSPTIVIGRNQNPWKECRVQEMNNEGVALARRLSGGGAVYQDLGNTCFTFLSMRDSYDTSRNFGILVRALARLGIAAEVSGRNDMLVNGSKISGSAFRLTNQVAFHHGTMLINVDTSALSRLLNPNKAKLESKGISSVKSRVLNLQTHFPDVTHEVLCDAIIQEFFKTYAASCDVQDLGIEQLAEIPSLKKYHEQFCDWNWRFGETPQFSHNFETRFPWGTVDVHVESKRGVIQQVKVFSDSLYPAMIEALEASLTNARYDPQGVTAACYDAESAIASAAPDAVPHVSEFRDWFIKVM